MFLVITAIAVSIFLVLFLIGYGIYDSFKFDYADYKDYRDTCHNNKYQDCDYETFLVIYQYARDNLYIGTDDYGRPLITYHIKNKGTYYIFLKYFALLRAYKYKEKIDKYNKGLEILNRSSCDVLNDLQKKIELTIRENTEQMKIASSEIVKQVRDLNLALKNNK